MDELATTALHASLSTCPHLCRFDSGRAIIQYGHRDLVSFYGFLRDWFCIVIVHRAIMVKSMQKGWLAIDTSFCINFSMKENLESAQRE